MFEGITPTKFGQVASPAPQQLHRLHITAPAAQLREVAHQVPLPVLDQEDLLKQGIDTSQLVKGAVKVDALGSCTCNAGTAHLAERMAAAGKGAAELGEGLGGITLAPGSTSAVVAEQFAILLYHAVTDQTGNPASEWPPTDCGSSGYYVCSELEHLGYASTYKTGSGVLGALSLLQSGTVMQGGVWFKEWFHPDSAGFVDADGSIAALEAALGSGVAGGHETLLCGIEQLALTSAGTVDLANTVLRARNSWSAAWGLGGDYLVHASTLDLLSSYYDWKQIVI